MHSYDRLPTLEAVFKFNHCTAKWNIEINIADGFFFKLKILQTLIFFVCCYREFHYLYADIRHGSQTQPVQSIHEDIQDPYRWSI